MRTASVKRASGRLPGLCVTAFVCGFCLMALELMGGRILQPAFGASIDVWAAVISTFILALAIGSIVGGVIADRSANPAWLGWLIVAAASIYLLLPAYAHPVIDALGPSIHAARWGSLVASIVLFLPPACLLGCVYPILVKRAFATAGRVGRVAGTLYGYPLPIAVVLNDRVMAEVLDEPRAARPNILIIGLGAGAGINILVLASRVPLDPDRHPLGWQRLERFQLYPELPEGRFMSAAVSLGDGRRYLTTSVPLMLQGIPLEPKLLERLRRGLASERLDGQRLQGERQVVRDPALIDEVIAAVQRRYAPHPPRGWDAGGRATELIYWETDWVALAREVFRRSVTMAADRGPRGFVHSGEVLVASERSDESSSRRMDVGGPAWTMTDAPLFTDAMANADLLNR